MAHLLGCWAHARNGCCQVGRRHVTSEAPLLQFLRLRAWPTGRLLAGL